MYGTHIYYDTYVLCKHILTHICIIHIYYIYIYIYTHIHIHTHIHITHTYIGGEDALRREVVRVAPAARFPPGAWGDYY